MGPNTWYFEDYGSLETKSSHLKIDGLEDDPASFLGFGLSCRRCEVCRFQGCRFRGEDR